MKVLSALSREEDTMAKNMTAEEAETIEFGCPNCGDDHPVTYVDLRARRFCPKKAEMFSAEMWEAKQAREALMLAVFEAVHGTSDVRDMTVISAAYERLLRAVGPEVEEARAEAWERAKTRARYRRTDHAKADFAECKRRWPDIAFETVGRYANAKWTDEEGYECQLLLEGSTSDLARAILEGHPEKKEA